MSSMFPRTGEAIAMRVADGHELVVRVRQADRPRIIVVPALDAPTNEGIEAAFVAGDGTGYRLRGRIAHREASETTIEVEGVTPLLGRFLRRFTPEPPLFADIGLLDETGTVYRRVQGRVRDLALAGAGVAAGLVAAALLARLMNAVLFAVTPTDAVTYAAVSVLLMAVALAACYVPARRRTAARTRSPPHRRRRGRRSRRGR